MEGKKSSEKKSKASESASTFDWSSRSDEVMKALGDPTHKFMFDGDESNALAVKAMKGRVDENVSNSFETIINNHMKEHSKREHNRIMAEMDRSRKNAGAEKLHKTYGNIADDLAITGVLTKGGWSFNGVEQEDSFIISKSNTGFNSQDITTAPSFLQGSSIIEEKSTPLKNFFEGCTEEELKECEAVANSITKGKAARLNKRAVLSSTKAPIHRALAKALDELKEREKANADRFFSREDLKRKLKKKLNEMGSARSASVSFRG